MKSLLLQLRKRNHRLVIGLMSGTSADAIDACLVKIGGYGTATRFEMLAELSWPYPADLKAEVLAASQADSSQVGQICRLNFLLGHLFAEAAKRVAQKAGIPLSQVDLIGSHGQTIHHLPEPVRRFGVQSGATLQIGDPMVIAKQTGVLTIGDFRVGDVALGGQGAPLVPYVDYLLFQRYRKGLLLVNLGGIANVTVLPAEGGLDRVFAFDTGPANMLIDALARRLFHQQADWDGAWAAKGRVSQPLLDHLMGHPFIGKRPPKSTGREEFGATLAESLIKSLHQEARLTPEDLMATATAFSVEALVCNYRCFIEPVTRVSEWIVSGGGCDNPTLMEHLRQKLAPMAINRSDQYGVPASTKEALAFALLAHETLWERPTSLPAVTGAARATVLGKICLP